MKIQTALAALIAAATLHAGSAEAQELYRATFRATCRVVDDDGRIRSVSIRERDLLELCLGENGNGLSARELARDYALVFNPEVNALQIVALSDGALICDVFFFDGGQEINDPRQRERFAFIFSPAQEEAVGTAILTERAVRQRNGQVSRASISGRLQFAFSGLEDPPMGLGRTDVKTEEGATNAFNIGTITNGVLNEITNGVINNITNGILESITNALPDVRVIELPDGSSFNVNGTEETGTNVFQLSATGRTSNSVADRLRAHGLVNGSGLSATGRADATSGKSSSSSRVFVTTSLADSNGDVSAASLNGALNSAQICTGTFRTGRRLELPANDD